MTWKTHRPTALVAATAAALTLTAGVGAAVAAGPGAPAASTSTQATIPAESYADLLVRAWGRGDLAATDYYATASVASALFAYSTPGGVHWRRTGWQGAAGTIYVTYHDDARGGTMTVGVSDVILSQGGTHAAYTVRFSQARPTDAAGYADDLVRAWGAGDHSGAWIYATPSVLQALFGHADPGGGHWRRTAVEGAAGTIFVTYHNDAGGGGLILGVNNFAENDGQWHAVYEARFTP